MNSRLPPELTSLYRLVLRSGAAATAHAGRSTRSIRALYRAPFEALVMAHKKTGDMSHRGLVDEWLRVFEKRADNTLSFLVNAGTTRGLPHRVVQNMQYLTSAENAINKAEGSRWNGQQPVDSYQPNVTHAALGNPKSKLLKKPKEEPKLDKRARWRKLEEESLNALGEAVRMAEGRSGLVLGRVKA